MSKICAKCDKPVYPTEELKCLDKSWHKLCFKCWECGMSLNMKNYKGFDKKPYCSAHYPQQKATVVAETPEMQRLTQASKNQSQTAYHDEFEKARGKYTQIADDPELRRVLKNQEIVSMAKYHEDFEKNIKGSKIQVVDDPESQRLKQLTSVVSEVEYKGLKEKVSEMEARRQNIGQANAGGLVDAANGHKSSPYSDRSISHSVLYAGSGAKVDGQSLQRKVGSISDYEPPLSGLSPAHNSSSAACRQEWEETIPMSNAQTQYQLYLEKQKQRQQQQPQQQQELLEQQERLQQLQLQQNDQQQRLKQQQQHEEQLRLRQLEEQQKQQQLEQQRLAQQQLEQQRLAQQQQLEQQKHAQQQQQRSPSHGQQKKPVYQAMYDYEAQDADEVGFKENDVIVDPEPIDDGWMFGTVERTGKRGMLPSNYVERIQ